VVAAAVAKTSLVLTPSAVEDESEAIEPFYCCSPVISGHLLGLVALGSRLLSAGSDLQEKL